MTRIYYIAHPKVQVDPNIPVRDWEISEEGLKQLEELFRNPWTERIQSVYSSPEKKAFDAARRMAERLDLTVNVLKELCGADRSLQKRWLSNEEFKKAANDFYQYPHQSSMSWERAAEVQRRNIEAFNEIIKENSDKKSIAIWGHGDAGTLLLCYLLKVPISRRYDMPQLGCYFIYDSETDRVIQNWEPMESISK